MDDPKIKERARWAIVRVITERGLSNKTLAPMMGVSDVTINNYRTMLRYPQNSFIDKFCNKFGYSREWFYTGQGEPYPGAANSWDDIPGAGRASIYNKDTTTHLPAGDAQRINIEEAMGKTYKVLTSETPYAVALYLNVQQFSNAVDATKELSTCQDRITNLEAQVGVLRSQVDRLTAPPITAGQQEASLVKEAM